MIKSLRRRHLQIWSAFLVLIPAGIVAAWLSVKPPVHGSLFQPSAAERLPNIISSAENSTYSVRLRSNDSLAEQLEWINKNILSVPSAAIYQTAPGHDGIKEAQLIGRVEARGNYYFPLRRQSIHEKPKFIVYDFIHEKIIDSIKLQP